MSAPFADNDLLTAARIRVPSEDLRAPARPGALLRFIRTPLAWVLLAILIGTVGAEGQIREGNRKECATVSMLIDRQSYLKQIGGAGGATRRIMDECQDLTNPDTYTRAQR